MSIHSTEIDVLPAGPRYSICTLVTKPDQYLDMLGSFRGRGFTEPDCEFLFVDNSAGNKHDGFSGYNAFLSAARGDLIILCHQDILLLADGREALDQRLAELTALDPVWGVCGNAGTKPSGEYAVRITDSYVANKSLGPFPAEVIGLDENFVVVRRRANLGITPHLQGFHLYALELCASASSLGMRSYVIDFHLRHIGGVLKVDQSYRDVHNAIVARRSGQLRPAVASSSSNDSAAFVSGWPLLDRIGNRLLRSRLRKHVFAFARALHAPASHATRRTRKTAKSRT